MLGFFIQPILFKLKYSPNARTFPRFRLAHSSSHTSRSNVSSLYVYMSCLISCLKLQIAAPPAGSLSVPQSWTNSRGQLRSCFCPADRCDPDHVSLPESSSPKGLHFLFILSDLTCLASCLENIQWIDLILISRFLIYSFITGKRLPHGSLFHGQIQILTSLFDVTSQNAKQISL